MGPTLGPRPIEAGIAAKAKTSHASVRRFLILGGTSLRKLREGRAGLGTVIVARTALSGRDLWNGQFLTRN